MKQLIKRILLVIGVSIIMFTALTFLLDYEEKPSKTNEVIIRDLKDQMNREYLQCNEYISRDKIDDCKTRLNNEFVENVRLLAGK